MTIPIAPIPGLEEAIQKRNEEQKPAQGAVIPPAAVPWLTALVAAALITAKSAPPGSPVQVVADSFVDVAVLFGLASPGWRRR